MCRRRMSGGGASGSGRQLQSTVLGGYKAELREFRALQEELQPWTDAFKEQHSRKPTLADVQATREHPPAMLVACRHHLALPVQQCALCMGEAESSVLPLVHLAVVRHGQS